MSNNKTTNLSFSIISKYRSFLMGLSILSIIFFHYTEDCVINSYNLKPLITYYKTYIGSCGVDIFLFLSGVGLYYSFKKKPDISSFFKKRFSRILIPYALVALPAWFIKDFLIDHSGAVQFLKDFLFITFFENGSKWFWYILMISVCYIIFPYLFDYIDSGNSISKMINIFTFITVVAMIFNLYSADFFSKTNIALLRFPAFFLGCFIGKASYNNEKIPKEASIVPILAILLLPLRKTSKTLLSRYILGLFGITLFVCIAIFMELLNRKTTKTIPLQKLVEWFGKYSLELYLTHVALRDILNFINIPTYRIRHYCLLIILSLIYSIIIKFLTNTIHKKIGANE